MRGRNQKTAKPKTPRERLNTSTIQKYLKEVTSKSPAADMKQAGRKDKKTQLKQKGGQGEKPREDMEQEGAGVMNDSEEIRNAIPFISKAEMTEMFTKLENVIKSEILSVQSDISHLLRRVEEIEETTDSQAKEIQDLKVQMKKIQDDNRLLIYKLEEQENQSRRQNLHIRDLPEQQNEDLRDKLQKIFNPILGRREDEVLRIDRVHRIRKLVYSRMNH